MSCYSKEKMDRNDQNNLCKSHSVRSDRELYRICPSKLSKRELEDLYFSLLENNIELKRTINGQQDKIRGLSTKVQRMNATQKNLQNKEVKDCCIGTKAIINEQKESITELKRANQRMADRIQMLNMRLCSAKQFFKKPAQPSTSRCLRCAANGGTCTPKKHNCLDKANEPAVMKVSTSTQVDERSITMKAAQTETSEDEIKEPSGQTCDENKCRSLMEELKLKIVHLQDELFTVHEEYASRITRLEGEVCDVRRENTRVTAQRKASEHELHNLLQRNTEILATCRNTHSRCAELAAQLSIERRKVAELETQLKASNMSDKVNKTIEDHLTTRNVSHVLFNVATDIQCALCMVVQGKLSRTW
ncbi:hypothetical protein B5X24_HaOG211823 [Helicoverpa armigera]|uniref:Uncharacterized protein n=1 Tax=Helicoverpa armigera TaxID=29058 RepID=A0A2W1BE90_HELAM|nr:hypothetical protein B5X24_HaOG211823 [Helicoverpa armigera]